MLVYDYDNQGWTRDGVYTVCGHPAGSLICFACSHAGLNAPTALTQFVHCTDCASPVRIERDGMAYCSSSTCGERLAEMVA